MDKQRSNAPLLTGLSALIAGTIGGIIYYRSVYLSRHFKRVDLTRSSTARTLGITEQYKPPRSIVKAGRYFAKKVLQPVRNELDKPIFINSWWRHPKTNDAVGGATNSDHLSAEGADLRTVIDGVFRNDLIAKAVINSGVPFTQLILEEGTLSRPEWIHLARRPGDNEREILRKDTAGNYSVLTENDILSIS